MTVWGCVVVAWQSLLNTDSGTVIRQKLQNKLTNDIHNFNIYQWCMTTNLWEFFRLYDKLHGESLFFVIVIVEFSRDAYSCVIFVYQSFTEYTFILNIFVISLFFTRLCNNDCKLHINVFLFFLIIGVELSLNILTFMLMCHFNSYGSECLL